MATGPVPSPLRKFSHKAFADGQAVWSWRPDAGAKFLERATRALGVTGAKEPGPRGELGVSRQPTAQGRPGVPAEPVVPAPCIFIRTGAAGISRYPAFPAPSRHSEGLDYCKARATTAARTLVHASLRGRRQTGMFDN